MTPLSLTPFQTQLTAKVEAFLREVGVPDVRTKKKRVHFDEEENEHDELHVAVTFTLEGDHFALWIYPDEAGFEEPGDEWWAFDKDEHTDEAGVQAAVLRHLEELFEPE